MLPFSLLFQVVVWQGFVTTHLFSDNIFSFESQSLYKKKIKYNFTFK